MTDDELDAAERRANAATPGPWESSIEGRDHDSGDSVVLTGGPDLYISYAEWPEKERRANEQRRANDLDFIAASRQDVPRLIAEVRRLRRRLSKG